MTIDYEDDDGWIEFEDDEEDWDDEAEETMSNMAKFEFEMEEEERIRGEKEREKILKNLPVLFFDPEDLVVPSILGGK